MTIRACLPRQLPGRATPFCLAGRQDAVPAGLVDDAAEELEHRVYLSDGEGEQRGMPIRVRCLRLAADEVHGEPPARIRRRIGEGNEAT